jgi:hypothetical protein
VPIKAIAAFKRVKALTKDLDVIANSLKASEHLVVSEDNRKVKRKTPLPEVDVTDIQRRTVVAENFQGSPTIGKPTATPAAACLVVQAQHASRKHAATAVHGRACVRAPTLFACLALQNLSQLSSPPMARSRWSVSAPRVPPAASCPPGWR